MKEKLLSCFFFIVMSASFAQDERDVINQIDSINTLAWNYYNNNDYLAYCWSFLVMKKCDRQITQDYLCLDRYWKTI